MKKLALSLAVLFGVAMVSCGNKDSKECGDSATCTDSVEAVAAEGEVVDSATGDSANVEAVAATETQTVTTEPAKEENKDAKADEQKPEEEKK